MNAVHAVFGALFAAAVGFGVLFMVLKDPNKTNTLFMAGANSIDDVTHALEGKS